jgi:hypothetical protein
LSSVSVVSWPTAGRKLVAAGAEAETHQPAAVECRIEVASHGDPGRGDVDAAPCGRRVECR